MLFIFRESEWLLVLSSAHWPKKWSQTPQQQIVLCIVKPRCCMEAIRQTSMISWAKASSVCFLAFKSLYWTKSNNFKGIETLKTISQIGSEPTVGFGTFGFRRLSIVGHGHPHINYFLILKGLEGSEPSLDYQKYNAVTLKLKQWVCLTDPPTLLEIGSHLFLCIDKTQTTRCL